MTLATELIQRYRIALQTLWNYHFWADPQYRNWDDLDSMNRLKLPLFVSLVTERLDYSGPPVKEIFGPAYQVIPRLAHSSIRGMLIESVPGNGAWGPTVRDIPKGKARIYILDFFDWEGLSAWELRYFKVQIVDVEGHPELSGRIGMIETTYVDVLWDPSSEQSDLNGDK